MAKKHTHKYYRGFINSVRVWVCALPDCTHYMPKHLESHLPGKATICWSCDEDTVLDGVNMSMDKPKCPDCYGIKDIDNFLQEKGAIKTVFGE